MDLAEILVTGGGLALIGLVVWYFFFSAPQAVSAAAGTGPQQIDVEVQGGYSPALIEVEHGRPVQLRFHRTEDASCSEEVVFPDFNLRRELPAFQTTLIELLPPRPGRYEFSCGMGMLRGSLVAK